MSYLWSLLLRGVLQVVAISLRHLLVQWTAASVTLVIEISAYGFSISSLRATSVVHFLWYITSSGVLNKRVIPCIEKISYYFSFPEVCTHFLADSVDSHCQAKSKRFMREGEYGRQNKSGFIIIIAINFVLLVQHHRMERVILYKTTERKLKTTHITKQETLCDLWCKK